MRMAAQQWLCLEDGKEQCSGLFFGKLISYQQKFQTQKKANAIPRNPVIAAALHSVDGLTGGQGSHQDQVYTYGAVYFHPNPNFWEMPLPEAIW